ncbi:B3 DNA-binding domain protein [Medicago truncatula]|uniref:B3 DNA-binding domain protein n=1 Tax=Medicago truncatula TaxID=3880 RepID=A0A072URX2_MEDTR|nr:B3 DNA-binding domain protein [Medicago truncatula]
MGPTPLQSAMLMGSPCFPNSIVWSQDNLIAVASGHKSCECSALEGECGFLAANLYAKSVFGEDALVNVSIEKQSDEGNRSIEAIARIFSYASIYLFVFLINNLCRFRVAATASSLVLLLLQILNHLLRPKSKTNVVLEPRRSSCARNTVPSYREEFGTDLPQLRKRSRSSSSSWGRSYTNTARPLNEIKKATDQERKRALDAAEALQINLQSSNPSLIKSMVWSHVYRGFWLGLPRRFCEEHLQKVDYKMVLEDEKGSEHDAVYLRKKTALSGGWRTFALKHKLDDGDAVVFELVEAARFKLFLRKRNTFKWTTANEVRYSNL